MKKCLVVLHFLMIWHSISNLPKKNYDLDENFLSNRPNQNCSFSALGGGGDGKVLVVFVV